MRRVLEAPATAIGPALVDSRGSTSHHALRRAVARSAAALTESGIRCLGILAENGAPWVVTDLACAAADVRRVPLPGFFTSAQLRHVIETAGVDAVATDTPERVPALLPGARPCHGFSSSQVGGLFVARLADGRERPPASAITVTFTSGTTGTPKGVELADSTLRRVADELRRVTRMTASDRHLCLLPLAVLLESVAGVYRTLLAGARVHVPALADAGMAGSGLAAVERMAAALETARPTSTILVPAQLGALVEHYERARSSAPTSLRFVGVGGAAVPAGLIERARAVGLPAQEGYGLTEAGSVVALNTPEAERTGSVGRPLPHLEVRIADDGEVLTRGSLAERYLDGALDQHDGWLATGDLGELDERGFLHLFGRKKNRIITGFGRNVSPEWIERELEGERGIRRAAVFGEGCTALTAVISSDAPTSAIERALRRVNHRLPDYARVGTWVRASEPFLAENGLLTANGRLVRSAIEDRHRTRLAELRRLA